MSCVLPGLAAALAHVACLAHGKETHWSGQVVLEGKEGMKRSEWPSVLISLIITHFLILGLYFLMS